MIENTFSFKCLGHTKRDDGLIGRYHLEVTDTRSSKTVTISVEPKHLASARSMKSILLGRKILYSVTQSKHDQMLNELFVTQPDAV